MTLEQQMTQALDGHFWTLDHSTGRVVDSAAPPVPKIKLRPARPLERTPPDGDKASKTPFGKLEKILQVVSRVSGVSVETLRSPKRDAESVKPRQLFCWAADEFTDYSSHRIGRAINRNYSTVLHSVDTVWNDKGYYEPWLTQIWDELSKAAERAKNNPAL